MQQPQPFLQLLSLACVLNLRNCNKWQHVRDNLRETLRKALKYGFLIYEIVILIGFALKGNITHEQFESEKWKNWTESEAERSLYCDVMNSLRNNNELKGKSTTEVIELLGIPETKSYSEFGYYFGMAKRRIDTGHFTIYFDQNKKVSRIKVYRG